ncbi:MAG: oligosaccharide flippase family protein [Flavobacteriaceae bacterium]
MNVLKISRKKIAPEQLFMFSVFLVNGGNYLYNLVLGRLLGPEAFAEAALLITLLLALSFMGMTFQLATAKFAVLFSGEQWEAFLGTIFRHASFIGLLAGALLLFFSNDLQTIFQTKSPWMFRVFGIGVPFYFLMSINRGKYQGQVDFVKLSITYQTEMWSRLLITMGLLLSVPLEPSLLVALGIAFSFLFGLIPPTGNSISLFKSKTLSTENKKRVSHFMMLTACYEFTQIIINNSDVLLVKHYFDPTQAGLYASLALIGRVVYFVAWMFVMLLLPSVVRKQKEGKPTAPILFKYVGYISLLSAGIILACYLFPELIISLMFGEAYISMAVLLWQYALATSLFAVSNIFAYYYLALDKYVPVILSGLLGMSQIVLVVFFHTSLAMVVQVQILAMVALLVAQLIYFANQKMAA